MSEIKGYKVLTDLQKHDVNTIKEYEANFLECLKGLWDCTGNDKRWLSIARTHIEEASMAACRAITQPDTVEF